MMDLERIIRFAAVAEDLSFTRAAERLRLDQAWLSRQIQLLEAQLGFPLFERNTRNVSLTPEGDALLAAAKEMAFTAARTKEALRSIVRARGASLRIGSSFSSYWLPARWRIIDTFEERYPAVRLEVVGDSCRRLLAKLRVGLIDIAILPASYSRLGQVESMNIHSSRPSILVPAECDLACRQSVSLADLDGRVIATTDPKLAPTIYADSYGQFIDAGAIPEIVQEGDIALNHYAMSERLILVAFGWPDSNPVPPPGFVHVPLHGEVHSIRYLMARRNDPPTVLMSRFWSHARQISEEFVREDVDLPE
jgi:DNA-binding transcriptional LysR family regulator